MLYRFKTIRVGICLFYNKVEDIRPNVSDKFDIIKKSI